MKHALKIILPIILILALIIGACCFFLIARRDLTESIFVYWGEHFYEAGRYSRAVAFYKAAMHFAPKDADLAIRLADAYKKSGNYTKAEYTLVSAITQIPDSVQLYVALSKTYVEQDKLLDAETMLGRITNDAVRTQIDALRPAAPVIEPESGNYSEYIDVTVTGASGTVYAVCNSDFPASEQDVYTGPISLEAGESKIVALSVAENGLVSDAVYAGYTVGNVVEEVKLADAGMARRPAAPLCPTNSGPLRNWISPIRSPRLRISPISPACTPCHCTTERDWICPCCPSCRRCGRSICPAARSRLPP